MKFSQLLALKATHCST